MIDLTKKQICQMSSVVQYAQTYYQTAKNSLACQISATRKSRVELHWQV